MKPSVYKIYENFIWKGEQADLAEKFYNTPPLTLDAIADRVPDLLKSYKETLWHIPEKMDTLKKALIEINKKLGSLTPKVRESIEAIDRGAVESAHQTVVLGGPAYVLNKAVTAAKVVALASEESVTREEAKKLAIEMLAKEIIDKTVTGW